MKTKCQSLLINFYLLALTLVPFIPVLLLKLAPERVIEILSQSEQLEDSAQAFADYDYKVHHELAVAGNNQNLCTYLKWL